MSRARLKKELVSQGQLQRVFDRTFNPYSYEKNTPLRSWAKIENTFTEVAAGSDTNSAVAVMPAQAIWAGLCTNSPTNWFCTSRTLVRFTTPFQRMSHETDAGTDGPSVSALTTSW